MKRVVTLAGLLLAAAAPAAAQPQAAEQADSTATENDEILVIGEANRSASTVATRVPIEALETPYTIQVVPDYVIEESGARSLSDALRYSGTVGGTDNFGNAGEFFSSRGFQLANGSNYFRDGLRYRKFGQVPLYDIERIEILRGPASILYGSVEPGGAVNIVSRTPQPDFGARLRLRGGSREFYQGTFDLTGPVTETVSLRAQGLFEDAESFRDLVASRSNGLSGVIDFRPTPTTLVTARASWFQDRRTGDRGTVLAFLPDGRFADAQGRRFDFAPVPRSRFLGERFGVNAFEDVNLSLSLRQELGSGWQLRGDLVRAAQDEDRVYIWAISTEQIVGESGLLNRQIGDWRARLRGDLARVELAGEVRTGFITHKLLLGGEYERFRNSRDNQRFQFRPIDIYSPVYLDARPPNGPRTVNAPFGSLLNTRGLYVQNIMEIGDQFVLLGGLRYFAYKDDNTLTNTTRLEAQGWTPQAGLVWRPTPYVSPYISYTRSFVPQSGTDRFGNPLDPERGEQYEAGVKLDWRAARALITLAIFSLDRDNLTVPDPVDPAFQTQAGLQRSQGFELSVDAAPAEGLRFTLAYNHLFKAEFVNDPRLTGNTIPNAPRNALGLFASYTLPGTGERLTVDGGITYVDRRFGIATNAFFLPAYTLVDLGLAYRLSESVRVRGNVRNLFDDTFYTGAINSTTVGIGAPRSFLLSLDFEY